MEKSFYSKGCHQDFMDCAFAYESIVTLENATHEIMFTYDV